MSRPTRSAARTVTPGRWSPATREAYGERARLRPPVRALAGAARPAPHDCMGSRVRVRGDRRGAWAGPRGDLPHRGGTRPKAGKRPVARAPGRGRADP